MLKNHGHSTAAFILWKIQRQQSLRAKLDFFFMFTVFREITRKKENLFSLFCSLNLLHSSSSLFHSSAKCVKGLLAIILSPVIFLWFWLGFSLWLWANHFIISMIWASVLMLYPFCRVTHSTPNWVQLDRKHNVSHVTQLNSELFTLFMR